MQVDWAPLRHALSEYRSYGITLPFWWRDDDAIEPTKALDRLAALSDDCKLPVHLAIIPACATDALAAYVEGSGLIPLVHGWAHRDHSGPGEKKNEFMTERDGLSDDSARGLSRMQALFGPQLRPIFVPPWNRIQNELLPRLSTQGYTGLSTFGPRTSVAVAELTQVNTHIDPIWWRGTRDLVAPTDLLAALCARLNARLRGAEDPTEPLGLLTHHLVHTPAIWAFTENLVHEMLSGGATPWTMETT